MSLIFLQVTSPATLLVQEGQPGKTITIHSNFPPAFLCDSFNSTSVCSLNIKVWVDPSYQNIVCPSSGAWSQIALSTGAMKSMSNVSCGIEITASNWQVDALIGVEAKIDNIIDGNQTQVVHVMGSVTSSSGVEKWSSVLQTVEVRNSSL